MRSWWLYSGLRLALFFGVLALLLLLGVEWWLAAVAATLVGFSVSYIFFRRLRTRVSADLARRHNDRAPATGDESVEDAAVAPHGGSEDESRRET